VALLGAGIAAILIPLAPPGIPVIASCAALAITADVKWLRRMR
jgi:hypothetical protein